ncbi:hypothetical protein PN36_05100 [Candidatus Thiomargarita nelsonii]|uniref:Uncharacterized protein n=1 Tax=Candidatus Thiomargarita nelsonii TaxID=1003181 RepID=A0A4E0R502_9GAMM|nr:hypothetical protein PN36_05100 [Candidatus Thiomargarita nelsonii]
MDNEDDNEKTYWHQILGRLFEFLLVPVGISVFTDVKVVKKLPEADVILLRLDSENWTKEQRERLPDGIRDSATKYILIEFKATESINKNSFIQASWYEYSYKRSQKINDDEIQTFVMCAKQPQKVNREQYGYTIRVQPGIYQSTIIAYNHITLISLNELPNELHNAWVTCLASKKLKKIKAFNLLKDKGFNQIQKPFKEFLVELWGLISTKGDDDMTLELSPTEIKAIGDMWGVQYYSQEELDNLFNERLRGLKPEERLMGLKPKDRLAGLKPKDRLAGLKPKDRLADLKPEQLEEIEAYIKQRKQQSI